MKKILSILSTISLSTITTTNIISCKPPNEEKKPNKPAEPKLIPQQPPTNSNWKLIDNKIILKNTGWYIIFYKWFGEFNIIKVNSSEIFGNDIKKI